MADNGTNKLRFMILRAISGKPYMHSSRGLLDSMALNGAKVSDSDFIREFTDLTQGGFIQATGIPAFDGVPLFSITRKGKELLASRFGATYSRAKVRREILEFLSLPPCMQTKASVFAYLREMGNDIDEIDFETVFQSCETNKLIDTAFMRCGVDSSIQYKITESGKAFLEDSKKPETAEVLKAAQLASDIMLLKLRNRKSGMGKNAICRMMRGDDSRGFRAREICIMLRGLESNGLLERGADGYRVTEKAVEYLNMRLSRLMNSAHKADLKTALVLFATDNGAIAERAQELFNEVQETKGGRC